MLSCSCYLGVKLHVSKGSGILLNDTSWLTDSRLKSAPGQPDNFSWYENLDHCKYKTYSVHLGWCVVRGQILTFGFAHFCLCMCNCDRETKRCGSREEGLGAVTCPGVFQTAVRDCGASQQCSMTQLLTLSAWVHKHTHIHMHTRTKWKTKEDSNKK